MILLFTVNSEESPFLKLFICKNVFFQKKLLAFVILGLIYKVGLKWL